MSCTAVKKRMILQLKTPRTRKQLGSVNGLSNYFRFCIPNMSKIAAPLTSLLKKDVPFVWSEKCELAFTEIQDKLLEDSSLLIPNLRKVFFLCMDSSEIAIRFLLAQKSDDKKLNVISFGSKK